MYSGDTFELNGATFTVEITHDDSHGAPWDENCGHGVVGKWERRDYSDAPRGHWILATDRGSWRLYNWFETMAIAKRDGWGLCDEEKAKLAKRLKREPTARDVRKEAVRRDFNYLYGWANDQWQYVVIGVTGEDGESEYLGGVEDSDPKYIEECARELAGELLYTVNKAKDLCEMELGG